MATETNTQTQKIVSDSKIELLDNSVVSVKITIPEQEVKKAYDDVLSEYKKYAHIKGFRKGKVPVEVIERKFGDSLKSEVMAHVIEKSVEEILTTTEHPPLHYSVPKLEGDVKLDLGKDFTFGIEYDTYPDVELGKYTDIEAEQALVTIEKEDIARELDALAEQNAVVIAKEGKAASGDVVTIDYAEIDDEGNEIPATKREAFTFTIGSGYNLYKIDDEIIGLTAGEEKNIEKSYDADFEYKDLAGRSVKLKVKLTGLKQKKLPALDDELAQDISEKYKTLEDLKNDIKSKLEEHAKQKVREKTIATLLEKIVGNSKFRGLPKSMIERELEVKWRSFLRMYRANEKLILKELEREGKSRESVLAEWQPKVEEGIKSQIVVEKMIDKENISVTEEEVDSFIKSEAEHHHVDLEEARKQYNDAARESVKFALGKEKLFDFLIEKAKIKKGAKVKYLDFIRETD
jgi:trigger factor